MDQKTKDSLIKDLWEGKHYAFAAPASSEDLTTTVSFEFLDLEKKNNWEPLEKKQKVAVILKVGLDKPVVRSKYDIMLDNFVYQMEFSKEDIKKRSLGPDDMIIETFRKAFKSRCFSSEILHGPEKRTACKYVFNHYFN